MLKYSSLGNDIQSKKMLSWALESSDFSADNFKEGKKSFKAQHAVIHEIEINGTPVDRLVLIDDEGHTLGFVSDGAVSSIKRLMDVWGEPPWDPPLELVVKEVKTKSGFRTYNLHVV